MGVIVVGIDSPIIEDGIAEKVVQEVVFVGNLGSVEHVVGVEMVHVLELVPDIAVVPVVVVWR